MIQRCPMIVITNIWETTNRNIESNGLDDLYRQDDHDNDLNINSTHAMGTKIHYMLYVLHIFIISCWISIIFVIQKENMCLKP